MENGKISDDQITASSQWDQRHAAIQGRLNFKADGSKSGAWSARYNNMNQWLQIDLIDQNTRVTRVATQGRNNVDQWVTRYKLEYSNDGRHFQYHREQGQTYDKVRKNNLILFRGLCDNLLLRNLFILRRNRKFLQSNKWPDTKRCLRA